MQPPRPAADFTLTAHTGERVSLHDFRGKLVLLYFGYTFCFGICPTTLANVAQVLHQVSTRANQVQLLMISVDPERDTPEKLAAYIPHFHPSFIGLTGSATEIAAVAPLFGIYYEKQESTNATSYWVDHSATLMVTHDVEEALALADQGIIFSPRPATIRLSISVPFPHPRPLSHRHMLALKGQILDGLGVKDPEGIQSACPRGPSQAQALRV
ncbi:MAG TPA: SCO family protein [Candidatus Tectomicrobia bacterium]